MGVHLRRGRYLRTLWLIAALAVWQAQCDTRRLLKTLKNTSCSAIRPVINESDAVQVSHEIVPVHIISFDEVVQRLKFSIWIRMEWRDEFLTWDPADFDGVENLRISANEIWTPDIVLYQNVDETSIYNEERAYPATVHYDGLVSYTLPGITVSFCRVNLTFYPFDTQTCKLKYSSWTHTLNYINLTQLSNYSERDEYQDNGEWELVDMNVTRNLEYYGCCPPRLFPDLTYTLTLRRNPDFYVTQMIIPYVMVSCMSVLVFVLPPESGEKMAMSVTTLLSLIVFNQVVIGTIPAASKDTFPIIGDYFSVMVGVVAAIIAASVTVLATYNMNNTGRPMCPVMRYVIFEVFARVVGCRSSCIKNTSSEIRSKVSRMRARSSSVVPHVDLATVCGRGHGSGKSYEVSDGGTTDDESGVAVSSLHTRIHYLSQVLASDSDRGYPIIDDSKVAYDSGCGGLSDGGPPAPLMTAGVESGSGPTKCCLTVGMERELGELSGRVAYLAQAKRIKETNRRISRQWKEGAIILDRTFFWFFLIVTVALPTFFLMKVMQII